MSELPLEKLPGNLSPTITLTELGAELIDILNKTSVGTSYEEFYMSITRLILKCVPNISEIRYYLVDREIELIQWLGTVNQKLEFKEANKGDQNEEFIQDSLRGILGATVQSGIPSTLSRRQLEHFEEGEICIPIRFENLVVGLIHVIREVVQHFTDNCQEKLLYISNAIGGFMKSKLLTQRLQRSQSKLEQVIIELQGVNTFLETIMNGVNEGIVVLDENLRITYLNPKAEQELGYLAGELHYDRYAGIIADASILVTHEETKKLRSGNHRTFRATLLAKDESELPVLIHASPIYRDQAFRGIIMAFTNLTRFIEFEEEILLLKGYHQRILDTLPIGVIGLSPEQRVTYTNQYFRDMTQRSIYGRSLEYIFTNIFTGSYSDSILLGLEESFVERRGLRINEIPFVVKKNHVTVNISLIPLVDYKNTFLGSVLVIEDDTAAYTLIERLRAAYTKLEERQDRLVRETQQRTEFQRELLKRTKELRQKNKEMEIFVYSVSHDLKTPIVSIQGFIGALIETLDVVSTTPEIEFFLNRIQKNAEYSKRLIRDILEYSQIGQEPAVVEEVNIKNLIQNAIDTLRSNIDFGNFSIELTSQDFPQLHVQRMRIHQVFINLIHNAWKFQNSTEDYPRLLISLEEDEKYWIFVFNDNGLGIPDDQREKVFNMFVRAHSNVESDIGGTGVGLAFSKKIIEIYNGRITLDSTEGKGSVFRVWLPKQPSFLSDIIF